MSDGEPLWVEDFMWVEDFKFAASLGMDPQG